MSEPIKELGSSRASSDGLLLARNIVAFAEVEELSEGPEVTIPPAAAALILKMAERLISKAEGAF